MSRAGDSVGGKAAPGAARVAASHLRVAGLVASNQLFERLSVPTLRLAYQLVVVRIGSRTLRKRILHPVLLDTSPTPL